MIERLIDVLDNDELKERLIDGVYAVVSVLDEYEDKLDDNGEDINVKLDYFNMPISEVSRGLMWHINQAC